LDSRQAPLPPLAAPRAHAGIRLDRELRDAEAAE